MPKLTGHRNSVRNAASRTEREVLDEPRRATAAFATRNVRGGVVRRGEGEALIDDASLSVGPVSVSFLDADVVRVVDYSIELDLWPEGQLVLNHLGRRFDTFTTELRRLRNHARVAGLLAHGISAPEVFTGALLGGGASRSAELQVYDTHVTAVPDDGDPFQVPFGTVTGTCVQDDSHAVVLETTDTPITIGQLGRQRDAFHRSVTKQLVEQSRLLAEVTGQDAFADGHGVARSRIRGFDRLVERFTAAERKACASALLAAATGDTRLGFVQLLDPDGEMLQSAAALPKHWAAFMLVPVGATTVLEILSGPAAATYVFREDIEIVNRDLQALHFRRAQLALTPAEAEMTPDNAHRLALRKLEPLQRLRACTAARLIHGEDWTGALRRALA